MQKRTEFSHFPFCCVFVFSTWVFLLTEKSDSEQETCFMNFIEENSAKCHFLH